MRERPGRGPELPQPRPQSDAAEAAVKDGGAHEGGGNLPEGGGAREGVGLVKKCYYMCLLTLHRVRDNTLWDRFVQH